MQNQEADLDPANYRLTGRPRTRYIGQLCRSHTSQSCFTAHQQLNPNALNSSTLLDFRYSRPQLLMLSNTGFRLFSKMVEMVKKYFPDKIEAGEKIIEQYKNQCAVVRIETTRMTGKSKV